MNPRLDCLFDWLEFTIKSTNPDEIILQVLSLSLADFIELPKGRYGYKKQKVCGHISVLFDGAEDMGTHVILSGQGCRELEADCNLLQLFDQVLLFDGKFTRIDVAVDDKTGEVIPFARIQKAIRKGYVSSRWRTSTEFIKRTLQDGKIIGNTINIGSKQSKMYLRIYDKAMEQESTEESWIRMELQVRDERAEKLQMVLLFDDNVGRIFSQVLNNYIKILKPCRDSNKSRWQIAPWWSSIILEVGKLKLTRQPENRSVEDVRNWVEKQIGPSLAMLVIADNGEIDDIIKIIVEGKSRLKDKHYKMLRGARNK
jgi:phage replication initiation protein